MNIPEFYLVEPYNAYTAQKGGRKKHWHEIIEEQALLERIIADQIALQEANSRTLPPNSPPTSVATAVGASTVAGGAGGVPTVDYFRPEADVASFSASPLTGDGPLTVIFSNRTTTPELDTYLWNFGDGTTSTDIHPIHVYQSGSTAGYKVELTASHAQGPSVMTSSYSYISASKPSLTANFTFVTASGTGPKLATFTNTTVNTSQTPSTTYLWRFVRNGNITTATTINATYTAHTGSNTASLQATGSYGLTSVTNSMFYVDAPTLTATLAVTTSSNAAPSTSSFAGVVTYNGDGTLTYLWNFGTGSIPNYTDANPPIAIYGLSGPYTASLQVTESLYGIATQVTRSWRLT